MTDSWCPRLEERTCRKGFQPWSPELRMASARSCGAWLSRSRFSNTARSRCFTPVGRATNAATFTKPKKGTCTGRALNRSEMARTMSSKPRSAPCAAALQTIQRAVTIKATFILFVFPMPGLLARVDFGDSEMPSQLAQLIRVDAAFNAHDGQLFWLRHQDREPTNLAVSGLHVDLGILVGLLTAHADNPRPGRRMQLRAHRFDVRILIFSLLRELETPDINALQTLDQFLD